MSEVPEGYAKLEENRKFITHFLKVIGMQTFHLSLFIINITADQVLPILGNRSFFYEILRYCGKNTKILYRYIYTYFNKMPTKK